MKKALLGVAAIALASGTSLYAVHANAETIAVPLGQQGEQSVDRPALGTKMAQVEAVYGPPVKKSGPVGKPAIYQWEYPGYTVYFEGDTVLHTVLKQKIRKQKQQRSTD
jgi:L-ascorbate metabolism protein UlaG (beta-lactamase superfamily)